jgi:uncharacterized protein (TIGR02246 family)
LSNDKQAHEDEMQTTGPVEKELIALERQYWRAIRDRDIEAALRLTDDPCVVTGAQGVGVLDKDSFRSMIEQTQFTLHDFDLDDDLQVRLVSDDVAIVAYKVHEKLTVDGKPVNLEAADASTWVKKNGRWLCALHTESITGDPFGRDRNGKGSAYRAADI